ncbi:MAG: cation-transporting P-type ATPase [Desulforhabdus sp.]|jgi:Ca2+-transporting ATPase|nr:cation-transporting P-type ATPase [Desulforhabdus sp.]
MGGREESRLNAPWARSWEEVAEELDTDPGRGLKGSEAQKRRDRYGPNRLNVIKKKSALVILWDQVKSPIVLLLAIAALLSFTFSQLLEGFSILAVIAINWAIGFFTELKATRSMEALQQIGKAGAKVLREGEFKEVSAEGLVPGDIVLLEAGDIVPADLRLAELSRLQADESSLTGESVAAGKDLSKLDGETPLADRKNMVFKGTAVTMGSGKGIVTATGMETELGRVASMAQEAEEELTPLEQRLNSLAYRLIWVTLGIAALMIIIGFISGQELFLIIETSIALAVAAIPEGLPIVATVALARGMWRMARRNALINRLSAVETLGATSIICTDKTGTLTENRMTLSQIFLPSLQRDEAEKIEIEGDEKEKSRFILNGDEVNLSDHPLLIEALEVGVLCNNAEMRESSENEKKVEGVGDPMEVALLAAGRKAGFTREELLKSKPEEREEAFDPSVMMMATYHKSDGSYLVAVKGAPEAVVDVCSRVRSDGGDKDFDEKSRMRWLEINSEMAASGYRVLAVAMKQSDSVDAKPYEYLSFIGLLGLMDPPRKDVKQAIRVCRNAGIRIIMVTGDQPVTARHIGSVLGLSDDIKVIHGRDLKNPEELSEQDRKKLLEASIFARVNPKQKLDLIALHQKNGSIVAMTGDGVNDAPALKKADIGVAMGKRGTQVAREAADIVLRDDAFRTIVLAVQQGRAIFDNIRKFILFLLSGNVGEIMIVAFAIIVGAPLPLLPLQILYLNMIGDVFPALALGVGKGGSSKMERPPRDPGEPVLARRHWIAIAGYGFIIATVVLLAFRIALVTLDMETDRAVTISFLTLAFARLWHVFNMRDNDSPVISNDVTQNPFVWGALALCSLLLIAALYLPGISTALQMVSPRMAGWSIIIGMSLIPLVIGQAIKRLGYWSF